MKGWRGLAIILGGGLVIYVAVIAAVLLVRGGASEPAPDIVYFSEGDPRSRIDEPVPNTRALPDPQALALQMDLAHDREELETAVNEDTRALVVTSVTASQLDPDWVLPWLQEGLLLVALDVPSQRLATLLGLPPPSASEAAASRAFSVIRMESGGPVISDRPFQDIERFGIWLRSALSSRSPSATGGGAS